MRNAGKDPYKYVGAQPTPRPPHARHFTRWLSRQTGPQLDADGDSDG